MSRKKTINAVETRERAVLIGVEIRDNPGLLTITESLEELALLADTAGLNPIGEVEQRLQRINPKTFIGTGKVTEIKAIVDELDASVVLFDDELNPRHQRELEQIFGENIRVIDRTALILDIFAQHASTHEGALQVELAQYEYRLPRLTRAWTHLARQAGGGGGRAGSAGGVGLRGPGEKQLEVDRREIRRRIDHLKKDLEKVRAHRGRHRSKRKKSRIPVIALVGYTNAGKSTLLNKLSNAKVYTADKLFATLDPTTRRVEMPGGALALFTDTVGFIQKLPTNLIAAFRATLEEITEADLLLHVVDYTHGSLHAQASAVFETLDQIGASDIPLLTVFNKIDKIDDKDINNPDVEFFGKSVFVSAKTGEGVLEMLPDIHLKLYESYSPISVKLPFNEGALIAKFHEHGQISKIEHTRDGVLIEGRLPGRLVAQYSQFNVDDERESIT